MIYRSRSHILLKAILIALFLLLSSPAPLPAQTPDRRPPPSAKGESSPIFETISIEAGLSSPHAQTILQDRQGFIWVGTLEGLNKYDGYEMTVYRPEPGNPNSVSDTAINGVYEDRAGNLWVATTNGGLNKFDPETETFTRYQHDPDDPRSLGENALSIAYGFYEDQGGDLWFSTWVGGLNKFDPETETFTRYQHDPNDPHSLSYDVILQMSPAVDGQKLWLGTWDGLDLFDPVSETFTHYQHDPADPYSLSHQQANAVYATTLAGQPVVWVGAGDGQLNQFDPETETFTHHHIGQTVITVIYEADDGLLWLGTQGEGIFIFDPATGSVVGQYRHERGRSDSLSGDLVNHIYQDQTGTLWIATYNGGVSRLDPQKQTFRLYQHQPDVPNSLSSSQVSALHMGRDGLLWIGTLDGGVNTFDPRTESFTRYLHDPDNSNSLSHNVINDVLEDRHGFIWIATSGGGLNRFDPATETFTRYRYDETNPDSLLSDLVEVIFEDSAGLLWVGTADEGVSRFHPTQEMFTHYRPDLADPDGVSGVNIFTIFEDSAGIMWIGVEHALNKFDPTTDRFIHYRHDDNAPNSLSHSLVNAIYEDDSGHLWLTTNVGLNKLDPVTGTFDHYFKEDGLPNDQLGSILADDEGYLWLGTSGGLARFDPRTETFRSYNQHDGLQGDLFYRKAAAKGPDGTLYFGGANGLSVFHPADLTDNPHPPPVVLTDFQLFNETVSPGSESPLPKQVDLIDEITLSHDQSVIGFEFVALDYTAPPNNQYAYMLDGFDRDWTTADSSRRFARYTNLDPGSYTFRVKASNNDGVWNETGAAVKFTITPPWWETTWFRGLAVVLAVGLLFGGFQWRVHAVERQRRHLARRVDERTKELQASEAALRQAKAWAEERSQAAEAANQAKSIFLANMSHELRTPLNTILGYAQILDDRPPLDPEVTKGVKTIRRSGDHLLTLIDEVLDIAKIEAEQIGLHPTEFNLPDFLGEIAEMIRLRADHKGLIFRFETVHFSPSGPVNGSTAGRPVTLPAVVRGDARRLRQILLNLLNNAVKYTDRGQITFRVGPVYTNEEREPEPTSPRRSSAPLLRFEVEDTGAGIPPDDLERIFEPFQQVKNGHGHSEGAGLGLTISRRLVEMMDGTLQVRSVTDQGSLFWFELTLPVVDHVQAIETTSRRIVGIDGIEGGERPKILIVDDVEDNRTVLAKQLTRLGFEVVEAEGGTDGLEKATEFNPTAIIVDRMMPGLDGLEIIRQMRQQPDLKESVMIVSSASVFEADRQESLAAGSDDFLPKPVKFEQLVAMLARHLALEWRYEEVPGGGNGRTEPPTPLSVADLPAPEEIAHLHHLAMMGHAAAIQEKAVVLAQTDEQLTPFAAEVERLATRLQMNELCDFLEPYLEQ